MYSKLEKAKTINDIQNPLIREVLKFYNISKPIELTCFSDIPSRTGLGGSSSFCVGVAHVINKILYNSINKKLLSTDAIYIERHILQESGGIQDQIWAAYGGLNTIEINTNGNFFVKPLPVTNEFKKEFEKSICLIYTNDQRNQNDIAKSYENTDKLNILKLAKESYSYFCNEDIKNIGKLLLESWNEKRQISNLISTEKIDQIINKVLDMGAYGAKLAGSGGCGFIIVICDPIVKQKINEVFKNDILSIEFENKGVSSII